MRDLRLVPVAAAVWIIAFASIMVPGGAVAVAAALWFIALTGLGLAAWMPRARRTSMVLALVALAVAASAASHVAVAAPARAEAVRLAVDGGRAVDIVATVSTKVERGAEGSLRFDADAHTLDIGGDTTPLAVPISVMVTVTDVTAANVSAAATLDLGSRVIVRGTSMASDVGDRSVLVVFASRGVEVTSSPAGVFALTSGLRASFVRTASSLPEPGGGLLPGLAVGDTRAVGADLDEAMKASSLSHLTAVSGANCAIVVGLAFASAAGLGARRGVRVTVALMALAGFVVLVTPEPSVIRAGTMASVAMIAVLLGRPAAGLSVLCLAVTVLLIGDPWLAASLGFALSAGATAALLVLAPPLARGMERWMPRALALMLAVPLAAQIVCGPLIVLIAPSIPVYGVLANLVAGPAAPAATIIGLASCLAVAVPWLSGLLAAIAWVPSAWIAATALTVAALPAAQLEWLEGMPGLVLLAALGGALVVLLVRARPGRTDARAKALALVFVTVSVGVLAGGAALRSVAGPLTVPGEWDIAACDIGQGDAVIARSAGRVALIDTGPDPAPLAACLLRLGVARVDLLVLTHFDLDHVGGVDAVIGRVDTLIHGPPADARDDALVAGFVASGARAIEAHAGQSGTLGAADWRVLWPRGEGHTFQAGNDASVVWEVTGGGLPHAVFLGDLSGSAQRAVMATNTFAPPYDVVKVAHHGSADQESALYALLDPSVALITVGADNDYGHPRDSLLDTLDDVGAVTARTDTQGLLMVEDSVNGVRVWRERPDSRPPPRRKRRRYPEIG